MSLRKAKNTITDAISIGIGEQLGHRVGNDLWWSIWGVIEDHICDRIIVTDKNVTLFGELQNLIYKLDKKQFEKHESPVGSKSNRKLNPNVKYTIHKKGLLIRVITTQYSSNNDQTQMIEYIILQVYGQNKKRFHNKVTELLSTANTKNEVAIFSYGEFGVLIKRLVPKLSERDVILPKETKESFLRVAKRWLKDVKYYKKHNLPFKIGILLYGEPGTGKSTLIKLIASIANSPILEMPLDHLHLFSTTIHDIREKTDKPIIVVLEDIDFIYQTRANNGGSAEQRKLFQILDGLQTPDNVMFIATTNYIDQIDKGLIRRFDYVSELKFWEKDTAIQYVKTMGYNEKLLDILDIDYPVQPSFLKSELLKFRING